MSRRGGFNPKYIAIAVVFFLFLYGFYSFHNVYTRLQNAEEKTARLGQQHDSVSAQLQVVYEHKNRLEKSLQQEKTDHQKTKDEMKQQQSESDVKYQSEKEELLGRIDSINRENKMLQMKIDDQELENTKLKEEVSNLQHDAEKRDTQHNEEFLQFKQEKEFEVAQLRDEASNVARKKQDLEYQLEAALKGQQLHQQQFQQEQLFNRQLLEEIQMLKGQLQNQAQGQNIGQQQPQFGQQKNLAGQQPNLLNQGGLQYQGQPAVHGQQAGLGLQNNNQQQPQAMNFNQNQVQQFGEAQPQFGQPHGGLGQPQAGGFDAVHNANIGQPQQQAQIQDDSMQIKQPDEKKSYFEPNVTEDNLEHKLAAEAKHQEDSMNDAGKVVQEQVIPPKLNEHQEQVVQEIDGGNEDHIENRYFEKRSEDEEGEVFNNRFKEENLADDLNRYREKPENEEKLEPDDFANFGEKKQFLFQGNQQKVIDQNGLNAINPLENDAIRAPAGVERNPQDEALPIQADSQVRHNDFDKALEEEVEGHRNPAFIADVNLDKAAEHVDFQEEQNAHYPLDRLEADQKDQAVDRPPLIGQGLRGGIPQHENGPLLFNERKPQEFEKEDFPQK